MEQRTPAYEAERPLRRSTQSRMLAGVAGGLADYFDLDVAIVRVGLVALAVMGGIGVPLYLAAWLLVPEEGADHTVADDLLDHFHDHRSFRESQPVAGPTH